jgi:hypothetical protein
MYVLAKIFVRERLARALQLQAQEFERGNGAGRSVPNCVINTVGAQCVRFSPTLYNSNVSVACDTNANDSTLRFRVPSTDVRQDPGEPSFGTISPETLHGGRTHAFTLQTDVTFPGLYIDGMF